jgi:hypothetical protein
MDGGRPSSTMFTKSALALAIILAINSGALAATTHRQHSPNVYDTTGHHIGSEYYNHASSLNERFMPSEPGYRRSPSALSSPHPNTQGYLCLCD